MGFILTMLNRSKVFEKEMRQRGYSAAEDWARRGKGKPETRPTPPVFDEENLRVWFEGWDGFWHEHEGGVDKQK